MTGTKSLSIEKSIAGRGLLRVSVVLLLLAPYWIWLLWIPKWTWPTLQEWLPSLFVATVQAWWSACLAMLVGAALFFAAQGFRSQRAVRLCELVLLLPNMVPPLFLILALLSWVTPWMAFPYGFGAVVAAHVLLNSGLVAVSLDRLAHSRLGSLSETAWLLGASRFYFLRRVAWPLLRADLSCILLFIFSLCFTSFSLPLVLGGEKMTTLEVAIFNTIRMEGRWDKAVILAACQSLILFLLAWLLPLPFWPAPTRLRSLTFLAWRRGRFLVFLPALFLTLGWLGGAWSALQAPHVTDERWFDAILTSLALGLSVGLLHLLLFILVSYVSPHAGLNRFLNGYLAPSPAITGFALLLLPGESLGFDFVKLVVALTLISFPLLYRWMGHSALSVLRDQVAVARVLGANWSLIFFEVIWPQAGPQLLRASGLAALWACGDFAVSGIVAGELNTLPLLMSGLLESYRIDLAQLLMFPLLLLGLTLYGFFVGASRYVTR